VYERREKTTRTSIVDGHVLKEAVHKNGLQLERLVRARNYQGYYHKRVFYEVSFQVIRFIATHGDLGKFSQHYLKRGASFITAFKQSASYGGNSFSAIENLLKKQIARL